MSLNTTLSALNQQMDLFDRAATFPGRPRERIIAMGEAEHLFFRLHPYHYRALQLVRVGSQLTHAGRKQTSPLQPCENRLITHLMGIMREAGAMGDLDLHEGWRPEELAFSLWSLAFGTRALMETSVAVRQLGIRNGFDASRQTISLLLDALEWRPFSWEIDYEHTRNRVVSFLLSGEAKTRTGS